MKIEEIINLLPDHWEVWSPDEARDVWWDDDRDYDKPVFVRKDSSARIYFNNNPDDSCVFSIAFDYHYDGECYPTFPEALEYAEWYVKNFPLPRYQCLNCHELATWHYSPSDSKSYYCSEHVPRGCSCNLDKDGISLLEDVNGVLKELPCCEYDYNIYGFVK